MKKDRTRISGSNLGLLASAKACRRCFWLMLIVGSKFPYRFPFPGVMFAMDKWEKVIVQAFIELYGCAPNWLGDLSIAESVLPPQSLRSEHGSGMTLIGKPDDVFNMPDGTLGLVDYKTASFRGEDDPLFEKYAVQLAVYALLLEETYSKKVSKAGLVYFEAETGAEGSDALKHLTKSGLSIDFSAHWLAVKINRKQVNELLTEAYELATTNNPPEAGEGCENCGNLSEIVELVEGTKIPLADARQLRCMTQSERAKLQHTIEYRKLCLDSTVMKVQDALKDIRHDDPWSVIGQWDFTDEFSN